MLEEWDYLGRIEELLGWKLDAEQENEALDQQEAGHSAEYVARCFRQQHLVAAIRQAARAPHAPPRRHQDRGHTGH